VTRFVGRSGNCLLALYALLLYAELKFYFQQPRLFAGTAILSLFTSGKFVKPAVTGMSDSSALPLAPTSCLGSASRSILKIMCAPRSSWATGTTVGKFGSAEHMRAPQIQGAVHGSHAPPYQVSPKSLSAAKEVALATFVARHASSLNAGRWLLTTRARLADARFGR